MDIIWVATDGDDISGDGSYDNPYETIDTALLYFDDGDQIRLKAGTYTPTDSVEISGYSGSLFADAPGAVFIQPDVTLSHQACVAVSDCERFSIQGITVLQASDPDGNNIGIYASNVQNLIIKTCSVDNFDVVSGNAYGIMVGGNLGRVEDCDVTNIVCGGDNLYGIYADGINVVSCFVDSLSGDPASCDVWGIYEDGGRV